MSSKFLIVGLGNPGEKFQKTRHNAGFMAVDFLLEKIDPKAKWQSNKKAKAEYTKTGFKDVQLELIKPQTFMNSSGEAVAYATKKHGLKPEQIIVIYDELDLPFGTIRVREKGSSAGHNGIKSIINSLCAENFWRIRIGIKNELAEKNPADKFVLKNFSVAELKELKDKILLQVMEEVEKIIDK